METTRLIIRKFTSEDWRDLHEYLSQPEVVRYEPYGVFSEEDSKAEAQRRSVDDAFWAVCLKETGKLIGNIYLARQPYDTWELGYVFNAEYQGMGYATEAAFALIDTAFQEGAHRVTAMCNPNNTRSWQLLERLGMRREGCQLQNVWFKTDDEGRPLWADTYLYGILASEWPERRTYQAAD